MVTMVTESMASIVSGFGLLLLYRVLKHSYDVIPLFEPWIFFHESTGSFTAVDFLRISGFFTNQRGTQCLSSVLSKLNNSMSRNREFNQLSFGLVD